MQALFNPSSASRATAAHFGARAWPALLLLVFTLVWLASLGTRSLVHADEGRYAALAMAMVRSGDWITPRLNGLLYFEKPALAYWIGALSFQWLGFTEFAARLWPGVAGLLTVMAVGLTARRLWGREDGLRAVAIAGSTTWIVGNSHFLTLDAGLTLFLTLALCAVLLAECGESEAHARRRWIWAAWAAMAGAVLSKGLVGLVIPGFTLLLASLWQRDFSLWRRLHWLSGLAILLGLTLPWLIAVSLRNPGFAEFFFIHEHFARYLTQVHRREGAWWYYLPLLLLGLMPWTSGLPWLLRGAVGADGAGGAQQTFARRLLISWSAFVLVFFSLSGSKLPSYILPMFPALALLLTLQLRAIDRRADASVLRRHLLVPVAVWAALLLASTQADRFASAMTPVEALHPMAAAARLGALVFLGSAALAWWRLGGPATARRTTAAVLCVALGHFAAMTMLMQAHDGFGQLKSAAPIAAVLRPLIDETTPVFAVRSYDQTLPFYLQRDIMLVDYSDEFAFGQQREPGKSLASLDDFIARWQALPQAAAYMTPPTHRQLSAMGVPMRVVFQDARRLMVVRR